MIRPQRSQRDSPAATARPRPVDPHPTSTARTVHRLALGAFVCFWAAVKVHSLTPKVILYGAGLCAARAIAISCWQRDCSEIRAVLGDLCSLPEDGTGWERVCRYLIGAEGYIMRYSLWLMLYQYFYEPALWLHELFELAAWGDYALCATEIVGVLVLSIGMNVLAHISSHRYFAHRSFAAGRPMQFVLGVLAGCSGQAGPLWWSGQHVAHHTHCDTAADPHCPSLKGFLYAHCLWIGSRDAMSVPLSSVDSWRSSPELWLCDVFHFEAHHLLFCPGVRMALTHIIPMSVFVIDPMLTTAEVFVLRKQAVSAICSLAFCVSLNTVSLTNSYCHTQSPSPACTGRDSGWVAMLNGGEGWHEQHHADPRCAHHGRGRGFDLTYVCIRGLERLGLVTNVKGPKGKEA